MNGPNHKKWLKPIYSQNNRKTMKDGFFPNLINLCKKYHMHEIASHGYTHIPFSSLTDEELLKR